ncbi:MAG: hypothetical protein QXU87_02040 [Candidatus Caldarchaeum sp.]|uniref:Uncharacterized protein n=1 Tax=Caldiarchaeum subterraneum TaxID=311458 RepID=A0A7C5Q3Z3_CALS0
MPKKSMSQKIMEVFELSDQLNRVLKSLSPEIREIVLKSIQRRPGRRRRRAKAGFRRRKKAREAMQQ